MSTTMYLSSIKLVVNTQRKQEKVEAIGGGRERFSVMGCQCMEWKKKREEESGSLCHAGSAAVVLSLHLAVKAQQCIYHMTPYFAKMLKLIFQQYLDSNTVVIILPQYPISLILFSLFDFLKSADLSWAFIQWLEQKYSVTILHSHILNN